MNKVSLTVLLVLFFIGLYAQNNYPDAYVSLNLPIYSNAELKHVSRNTTDLTDGIKVMLESSSDYATLRSYFESEMESRGWTMNESIAIQKMRESGKLETIPFSGEWTKGDMKFQIFTSKWNDKTKLNLTLLQK